MVVVIVLLVLIIAIVAILIFGGAEQRAISKNSKKEKEKTQKEAKQELKNKRKEIKRTDKEYIDLLNVEENQNIQEGRTKDAKEYEEEKNEITPNIVEDIFKEDITKYINEEEGNNSKKENTQKLEENKDFESYISNEKFDEGFEFNKDIFGEIKFSKESSKKEIKEGLENPNE